METENCKDSQDNKQTLYKSYHSGKPITAQAVTLAKCVIA